MIIKSKAVVEIYNDSILYHEIKKGPFEYDKAAQFNGKRLYVFVFNKEIYIHKITLPKVNRNDTMRLLYNELKCNVDDADSVVYNFIVLKTTLNTQDLIVYYVSWRKLEVLKDLVKNHNIIKKISTIQFCYLRYFSKFINCNNFIFCFRLKEYCYFAVCENKILIYNKILSLSDSPDIINEIANLKDEICNCNIEGIFLENIDIPNLLKDNISGIKITRLDDILPERIMDFSIKNEDAL